ncbi:MFS transporter [Microbacterium sp. A196]|uniref:MFS transporter n=1 Tax=Microbacterium sp. A196 TaxID=3457320 RepID=UPI003FD06747
MTAGEPLWTRDYVLATVLNLFVAAIFYELVTTTALYAIDRFDASDAAAGTVAGAFMIGAVTGRLVSGKLLDTIGRRRALLCGLGACIVLPLLCGQVGELWILVLLRALHGAAFGLASTAVSTIALTLVPAHRRGEGAGYFGLAPVLASAVGAASGNVLIHAIGYSALFAANSVFAAIGLVIALALRIREHAPTEEQRRLARRWSPLTLVDGPAASRSLIVFVAAIGLSTVLAFLNVQAAAQGAAEPAGVYFAAYAVVAIIARLVIGKALDRLGERVIVPPLLASLAAGLAVLALPMTTVTLILSAGLVGVGFGALFPSVHAAVFSASPPHRAALATSTFYLVGDAGIGIGPLLAGALVPWLGFDGLYVLLAAVTAGAIIPWLLRTRPRTDPQ